MKSKEFLWKDPGLWNGTLCYVSVAYHDDEPHAVDRTTTAIHAGAKANDDLAPKGIVVMGKKGL